MGFIWITRRSFFSSYINNFLKFLLRPTLSLNEKKEIILSNGVVHVFNINFEKINSQQGIIFHIYRGKD